jgi:hypothetical protein
MGYNAQDLTPLNPDYPSPLNPVRKEFAIVPFQVARSNTTAFKVAVLPEDATILGVRYYNNTAVSNAGTTATVTITATPLGPGSGGQYTLGTYDAKGTSTGSGFVSSSTEFNLSRAGAQLGDILIKAVYAETGTASTSGGPWIFLIEYTR